MPSVLENAAQNITGIKVGQTVKLSKTLNLTDASSVLNLTQAAATSTAPSFSRDYL